MNSDVLLLSDPAVAAIPVADTGEELVDLRLVPGLRLDGRKRDADGAYAFARAGAADRLLAAQSVLPPGVRLLIVEAYRPPPLQQRYFSAYRETLAAARPDASATELDVLASRYISPVAVAPHCTGGAIDLTLCTEQGIELDLGTAVNANPEESAGGCFTDSPAVIGRARELRDVLVSAMTGAGFVNYPTEWWHYSVGERYWSAVTGVTTARYGPVDPPYLDLKSRS
jgi:D-alanyl-D-alanine dipeptidase